MLAKSTVQSQALRYLIATPITGSISAERAVHSMSICTRIFQVAECQAIAGRLADQLACDTQPAQAMDDDLAADMAEEEHNSPHGADEAPAEHPVADVAPAERAEAETAAAEEMRVEERPATAPRQSGRGKEKVTQCTKSRGKALVIQGDMRACLSSMLVYVLAPVLFRCPFNVQTRLAVH